MKQLGNSSSLVKNVNSFAEHNNMNVNKNTASIPRLLDFNSAGKVMTHSVKDLTRINKHSTLIAPNCFSNQNDMSRRGGSPFNTYRVVQTGLLCNIKDSTHFNDKIGIIVSKSSMSVANP